MQKRQEAGPRRIWSSVPIAGEVSGAVRAVKSITLNTNTIGIGASATV